MNINTARKSMEEMEACFTEAGLPIVSETEKVNKPTCTDHLRFQSCVRKNDELVEITAFIIPSSEIGRLSIGFQTEITDAILPALMELVNVMNFSTRDCFWLVGGNTKSMEFRTGFGVPSGNIDREHFGKCLTEFLDLGYKQYRYVRRLIEEGEALSVLKRDFMSMMMLDSHRKRYHQKMEVRFWSVS
jgi:hypothetical protein